MLQKGCYSAKIKSVKTLYLQNIPAIWYMQYQISTTSVEKKYPGAFSELLCLHIFFKGVPYIPPIPKKICLMH